MPRKNEVTFDFIKRCGHSYTREIFSVAKKNVLDAVTKHFFSCRKYFFLAFLFFFLLSEIFSVARKNILAARKKMFCHYLSKILKKEKKSWH